MTQEMQNGREKGSINGKYYIRCPKSEQQNEVDKRSKQTLVSDDRHPHQTCWQKKQAEMKGGKE